MKPDKKEYVGQWLKGLERESWQLELLVSGFTIFLLIQGISAFDSFQTKFLYSYDVDDNILEFVFIFMRLLSLSLKALALFLVVHLFLRGFWIGTIGLRSVQDKIHLEDLKYSKHFTEKLKKKVITLDSLIIQLDEICSIIFSTAFLFISILIAFGLYLLLLSGIALVFDVLSTTSSGGLSNIIEILGGIATFLILLSGFVYFIDYFTLGFFKKFQWVSKIYYPFYNLLGYITFAWISRSIYYHLISKFSKKRIRLVFLFGAILFLAQSFIDYEQHQFFPDGRSAHEFLANRYDNLRPSESFILDASIQSNMIDEDFIQLFLRYDPSDNEAMQLNCPDFTPVKKQRFNWSKRIVRSDGGFLITDRRYTSTEIDELMQCLSSFYSIFINNDAITDFTLRFYEHPSKDQMGFLTMINSTVCQPGENVLLIQKQVVQNSDEIELTDLVEIPFWYSSNSITQD